MKIITVLGTRPEIIRLARIIPLLDEASEHILAFTGQNFDPRLSDIFFQQLEIRKPNYSLETQAASTWEQIGKILSQVDKILEQEQPDRFLVLGDTNSALTTQCAKRRGIKVYHMEAGNRCFDDRVPEEINRRVIDHSSDILLPYTERSRDNLIQEGIAPHRIFVTGNPIAEVLNFYQPQIDTSGILDTLKLKPKNYFLVTLHRAENVDNPARLQDILAGLKLIQTSFKLPIVISLHPRTKAKLNPQELSELNFIDPPGFFDFVHLEKNAQAILSDSGTVQEEACILKIPSVTLRDSTERPETIECGSNILSGSNSKAILKCLEQALSHSWDWQVPLEYQTLHVSMVIRNIIA